MNRTCCLPCQMQKAFTPMRFMETHIEARQKAPTQQHSNYQAQPST